MPCLHGTGDNSFTWFEPEKLSLTRIGLYKSVYKPLYKNPYKTYVGFQIMGTDSHSQGLLKILREQGFTEQKSK